MHIGCPSDPLRIPSESHSMCMTPPLHGPFLSGNQLRSSDTDFCSKPEEGVAAIIRCRCKVYALYQEIHNSPTLNLYAFCHDIMLGLGPGLNGYGTCNIHNGSSSTLLGRMQSILPSPLRGRSSEIRTLPAAPSCFRCPSSCRQSQCRNRFRSIGDLQVTHSKCPVLGNFPLS